MAKVPSVPDSIEMQLDHDMEKIYRERMGWQPKTVKDRFETPDPTPVATPLNPQRKSSLFDLVYQRLRREMLSGQLAESHGMESFEDAEDFDVQDADEFFPVGRHEADENELTSAELRELAREAEEREKKAAVQPSPEPGAPSSDE
jgi:hypothetical protein